MTRKKIHIDELFRNRLKGLSLFVSNKDMEAIDDKKSLLNESDTPIPITPFSDFELETSDADWMNTKSKLDLERASMANVNSFEAAFDGFEIEPHVEDWPITYRKYIGAKNRKLWWWLGTGILALLIGLSLLIANTVNKPIDVALANKNKIYTNENNVSKIQKPLETDVQSVHPPKHTENAQSTLKKQEENTHLGLRKSIEKLSSFSKPASAHQKNNKSIQKFDGIALAGKSENDKSIKSNSFPRSIIPLEQKSNILKSKMENKPELNNDPKFEITDKKESIQEDIQVPKFNKSIISEDSIKKKIKINDDKKPSKAVLGLYVAIINQINYGSRVLSKGNNDFYNSIRKNADKANVSWTKGLEFGVLKSNTQISIGIQATSQTMASNYKYSYRVYDSIPVYNPGRTQIIGYFLLRGRDTFINEENEVKINRVQVPLAFSRLIRINDKMKFIIGTSVVMDYARKYSGTKMLNPMNNQLYYYKNLQSFERRLNVLPSLNFGVNYQLKNNFVIQSSVFTNAAIFGRFKNNFSANEQAYNLGINLKLLYLIK